MRPFDHESHQMRRVFTSGPLELFEKLRVDPLIKTVNEQLAKQADEGPSRYSAPAARNLRAVELAYGARPQAAERRVLRETGVGH